MFALQETGNEIRRRNLKNSIDLQEENRLARMEFKIAVELSMLAHMIAYHSESRIDESTFRKLHAKCAEEVKRLNGAVELAEKFIDFGILKKKSFNDCRHIAAAILAGCDIITSRNFKHIINVKTVRGVKIITILEGYKDLLIYPPSVLLEGDDEGDDETSGQ